MSAFSLQFLPRVTALVIGAWLCLPAFASERLADLEQFSPSDYAIRYWNVRPNHRTGDYEITLTVTNTSGRPFPAATALLAVEDVGPSPIRLANADAVSVDGVPYFQIDTSQFGPGAQFSVRPRFANAGRLFVQYTPRLYFRPPNGPPVAHAGPDQSARVGQSVTLDGAGSFDPDGDLIGFAWSVLQAPAGSTATLDAAASVRPRLVPDLPGDFQLSLQVSDGRLQSAPATVAVTVVDGLAPPNSRAGRDQRVRLGETVVVDGGASDDPNDLPLGFQWTLSARPAGSQLTNADVVSLGGARAQFTPDAPGEYRLTLQVDNGNLAAADDLIVEAFSGPVSPTADAGADLIARPGEPVQLNGSASRDPDQSPQPLNYQWRLAAAPTGSALGPDAITDADQSVASLTPDADGTYVVRLEVSDGQASDTDHAAVLADSTPPVIESLTPADGSASDARRPSISARFSDPGAGLDHDSVRLLINGADVTGGATVGDGQISYTPGSDLPGGTNEVTLRVADRAGNQTELTHRFTVTVFRAIADCGPTVGVPPLAVTYRSRAQFTGGSIVRYRWDRDGNGTFDTSDSVPSDYSFTFNNAGNYSAVLEVQNNFGELATDTCTINVQQQGPTAIANAAPSNGPVPLAVALTCQGQTQNGAITRWEWDFDGDGGYDASSTVSGNASHTYDTIGEFGARCRVTDAAGLTGVSNLINTLVRPQPSGSPTVTATANRTTGNAPLAVSFGGAIGGGGPITLYEWDFDSDGVIDRTSPSSAAASYTYTDGGVFSATLRVTNTAGLTSSDSIAIEAGVTATLAIVGGTFAPETGGTTTVRTTLSGTVPTRLVIKNRSGRAVRSLIQATRSAGTYNDPWDGRDDAGALLPDGPYHAVLEYRIGESTSVLDLTDSTGGTRSNPSRNSLPSTFSPYENNPLAIQFTLGSAAEVLAFVGLFNTDTRLVTLLDRQPLGAGTHTIFWDGLLPSGARAVAPPGDSFLFGIWAYALPNNSMYLVSAPRLSNFSVQPPLFSPTRDGSGLLEVRFDLDKAADVDLSVTNLSTGRPIYNTRVSGIPAGASRALTWNGLTSEGLLPDRGEYRLALTAIDGAGNPSLTRYLLLRVFY